ncbi:hypothetical protein, partial [Arthrobacter sp. DR-2P]
VALLGRRGRRVRPLAGQPFGRPGFRRQLHPLRAADDARRSGSAPHLQYIRGKGPAGPLGGLSRHPGAPLLLRFPDGDSGPRPRREPGPIPGAGGV